MNSPTGDYFADEHSGLLYSRATATQFLVYFSVLHDGCFLIDLHCCFIRFACFLLISSSAMADLPPPKGSTSAVDARLSEHERAVIQRQLDAPTVNATFLKLFQYATTTDLIIIFI